MAFLVPRSVSCKLDNDIDFVKGKKYLCTSNLHFASNGYSWTKGKVYECTQSYSIPCNNGTQISQWKIVSRYMNFKEM